MQILAEILAADSERRADRHFRRFADLSRPLPGGGGGKGEGARTLEDSLALSLSLSLSNPAFYDAALRFGNSKLLSPMTPGCGRPRISADKR